MGIKQRNIWKFYDSWRIHSNKKRLVNKLVKEASGKIVTKYTKHNKIFAWDVEVNSTNIDIARKIIKDYGRN